MHQHAEEFLQPLPLVTAQNVVNAANRAAPKGSGSQNAGQERTNRSYSSYRIPPISMRFSSLVLILLVLACDHAAGQDRGARVTAQDPTNKNETWRQRKDYALLFATNEYQSWEPLINPIPDAEAIAAELRDSYGFEAEMVRNPTRERIFTKLREYSQKNFGPADQLFIFFAGHGIFDEVFQSGYIVARDSRKDDETRGSYASYNELRTIVNSMRSKHIFLVMDACYSGTFDRRIGEAGMRGSESYSNFSFPELFGKKFNLETRKYLTSGGKEYVPDGLPGHHSPFAAHLLEELRTYGRSQGYLTFSNVLTAVERTNPEPYWGEWGDNQPGSDFFFVAKQFTAKLASASLPGAETTSIESAATRGASTSLPASRPSIAVLGFRNLSGRPDEAWLSTALSEWLTTELSAGEKFRAIAGENVARVKLDLAIQESSGYAKDTLGRIYKGLGAEYIVSGSYTVLARPAQGTIRVDLRLQNAATGEMLEQAAEAGSQTNLPELVNRLGARLRGKLGIEIPSPAEAKAVQAALPTKTESSRLYSNGLEKLRAYDLLAARDSLQAAVEADPKSALAHHALARAWSELGYDSKAKLEAATATDLARNLSQQSRLTIEASSHRLNAQWDQAIKIYQSLATFFPDETDYGLELAKVQTDAGKGKDALVTLASLRHSSKQAEDDPRVDLQEALAASSLSDFKLKQAAAERSAGLAAKQGARLLEAEAYWQDCSARLSLGDQKGAEAACLKASAASDLSAGRKVRARSLTVLATIRESQGKNSEAMELRQEALNIATQIGSRMDQVGALLNLARLQSAQGQLDNAQQNYQLAMNIAREIDDKQQLVKLQLNTANLLYSKGDFSAAQEMYEQCRSSAAEMGDKANVARASRNLAVLALQLGDVNRAEKDIRESISISQSAGLQARYASALNALGDVLLARADLAGARKAYEEALELYTKFKDHSNIAASRLSLAGVGLEEGNAKQAEALALQALQAFQEEKSPDQEAQARETLARALIAQKRHAEAVAEISAAKKLSFQDYAIQASVDITGARLSAWSGNLAEAKQSLETCFRNVGRVKLAGIQLDIRLAQAEIETSTDAAAAQAQLSQLESDAKSRGYLLIVAKVARLQQLR